MLIVNNPPRKWRKKASLYLPLPAETGPVLVEAVYESMTAVTLTFDRAVTTTLVMLTGIRVFDGDQNEAYHGEDFEVLSPTSLRVNLYFDEAYTGEGVTLRTVGETGIVATNDGSPWAGVTNVTLPFAATKREAA